ncbi:MAG: hypothetical protein ACI9GB_002196 [Halioglobus sp.]|jgi:hypothetical protein
MINKLRTVLTPLSIAVATCHSGGAVAQSVPANLLDISLEELFVADLSDTKELYKESGKRWHLRYDSQSSNYEDYLDGSSKLSIDEVLFVPGQTARTDKNFPVVPTRIKQEVHALSLSYDASEAWTAAITLPYVKQSTDHISILPGYSRVNITSKGVGDTALVAQYRFAETLSSRWKLGFGLSVPTGSIDEEGDTPRAPGVQQLPYTMQLGSGTFDLPLYLAFASATNLLNWGAEASAKLRVGRNDRDYSLGNSFSASAWTRLVSWEWIKPSLRLSYRNWGDIDGADEDLMVPGPYPYPAPVVNPNLFGGELIDLTVGVLIPLFGPGQALELEYGQPLYQSLNGPQSSQDYHVSLSLRISLL